MMKFDSFNWKTKFKYILYRLFDSSILNFVLNKLSIAFKRSKFECILLSFSENHKFFIIVICFNLNS